MPAAPGPGTSGKAILLGLHARNRLHDFGDDVRAEAAV